MRGGLNHTESNTNTKQRKNLWKINDNDKDEQDTQRVALLCLSLAQGEKMHGKLLLRISTEVSLKSYSLFHDGC